MLGVDLIDPYLALVVQLKALVGRLGKTLNNCASSRWFCDIYNATCKTRNSRSAVPAHSNTRSTHIQGQTGLASQGEGDLYSAGSGLQHSPTDLASWTSGEKWVVWWGAGGTSNPPHPCEATACAFAFALLHFQGLQIPSCLQPIPPWWGAWWSATWAQTAWSPSQWLMCLIHSNMHCKADTAL